MSPQSFPVHKTTPVSDKTSVSEKSSYRTSIFQEAGELPRLWGRESQSGYTSKRTLTSCSGGEKDFSIDDAAQVYEEHAIDTGRRPALAGYRYEIPERYGGNETSYRENTLIPLSRSNNTWVPLCE
ncbi:hypothetical protein V8E51_017149 [Hyaloscypha variabilis]